MELLKYVYFYAQKSIIKAGNNKFQDLMNAPRMLGGNLGSLLYGDVSVMVEFTNTNYYSLVVN